MNHPLCNPHVLACGGTEIILTKRKGKEVFWNKSNTEGSVTGGGVSELFAIPA